MWTGANWTHVWGRTRNVCELHLHWTSGSCHFDVSFKRHERLNRCTRVIPHNYSKVVASIKRKSINLDITTVLSRYMEQLECISPRTHLHATAQAKAVHQTTFPWKKKKNIFFSSLSMGILEITQLPFLVNALIVHIWASKISNTKPWKTVSNRMRRWNEWTLFLLLVLYIGSFNYSRGRACKSFISISGCCRIFLTSLWTALP